MNRDKAREMMNEYGARVKPFIFIIDFDMLHTEVFSLEQAESKGIKFAIGRENNINRKAPEFTFRKIPLSKARYKKAFDRVYRELNYGNSYLLNLTMPTRIETSLSMDEIFRFSRASYKLLLPSKFVVFSPESFVKINDGIISTFPMKGTLNAAIPEAEKKVLSDPKEQAEHATIVDLLRNDLSMVSTNVKVKKYRYVEKVDIPGGALLQVSSEITGELPTDYKSKLGDILFRLLPAGSVTGAPKEKTVEIIKEAEGYERGYFTGIFGYFDGKKLESAVMIRFIEKTPKGYIFKSGGGITAQSDLEKEYAELIEKVYVPIV